MKAVYLFIIALELFNDPVAVPGDFDSELHLARHLFQHIFQRGVDALQHLADIIIRAEDGAETHRDDAMRLHHSLDNVLVGQGVFACGVEDEDAGLAHHGCDIAMVHAINLLADAAHARAAETDRLFTRRRLNHPASTAPARARVTRCWRGVAPRLPQYT